jgi:Fe-S-cluster containining protein
LANYLLGGILADQSGAMAIGQQRIHAQIEARVGVTPYGVIPSLAYKRNEETYQAQKKDFFKGARELYDAMLCPYYDAGNCSIWKFRENLCVTHFCSSVGGSKGHFFWHKLNDYLTLVEQSLSKYTLLQLGWPPEAIDTKATQSKNLNTEDEQGLVSDKAYQKMWRDWVGREAELFLTSYEIIQGLDRSQFVAMLGQDAQILEAAIQTSALSFQDAIIPEQLLLHPEVQMEPSSKPGYQILRKGTQEAEVPQVILPLIKAFNGQRNTVEVFDLAYRILYSLGNLVEELREKGILVGSLH